jgi:hypothetical protein
VWYCHLVACSVGVLDVELRNNFVESLVLADRVAVICVVIDFLDDVICFYSSQMFFCVVCSILCMCVCVWCTVQYIVCVCVCGVHYIVCVYVCSISCLCVCMWYAVYRVCACGVQYIVCVCVWCAVYISQYTSL